MDRIFFYMEIQDVQSIEATLIEIVAWNTRFEKVVHAYGAVSYATMKTVHSINSTHTRTENAHMHTHMPKWKVNIEGGI